MELSPRINPEQPTGLDYYVLNDSHERLPRFDPHKQPSMEPCSADDAFSRACWKPCPRLRPQAPGVHSRSTTAGMFYFFSESMLVPPWNWSETLGHKAFNA